VIRLVHPRLLLGTPLAIPLGVPENLFHLLLSVPALVIVLLQLHSARSHVPERGQARALPIAAGARAEHHTQERDQSGRDPMNTKVNLDQQFKLFHDHWHPRIVATVNDYDIKLVKVQGEFVWHQHQDTDELFLVIDGQLRIQLQDHDDVVLGPGELFVVPREVRHCPAADQETRVLLLELQDTVNTGDADRVGTVGERLS
jgi:mannose-6-phosphate isomerase-like protein (cupin superfamily)